MTSLIFLNHLLRKSKKYEWNDKSQVQTHHIFCILDRIYSAKFKGDVINFFRRDEQIHFEQKFTMLIITLKYSQDFKAFGFVIPD